MPNHWLIQLLSQRFVAEWYTRRDNVVSAYFAAICRTKLNQFDYVQQIPATKIFAIIHHVTLGDMSPCVPTFTHFSCNLSRNALQDKLHQNTSNYTAGSCDCQTRRNLEACATYLSAMGSATCLTMVFPGKLHNATPPFPLKVHLPGILPRKQKTTDTTFQLHHRKLRGACAKALCLVHKPLDIILDIYSCSHFPVSIQFVLVVQVDLRIQYSNLQSANLLLFLKKDF